MLELPNNRSNYEVRLVSLNDDCLKPNILNSEVILKNVKC